MINIRSYQSSDCEAVTELFFNAVHGVCKKDYPEEALFAWAPANPDLLAWNERLSRLYTILAFKQNTLVGFESMDLRKNYLDHLFVHEKWQGRGVATILCDQLESKVSRPIVTQASITAKAFFEYRGYVVVREQKVCCRGVFLKNYLMRLG